MKRLWPINHDRVLAQLYAEQTDKTTDRLAFDAVELERLARQLNDECETNYHPVAVGKRLINLRKKRLLVRKHFR